MGVPPDGISHLGIVSARRLHYAPLLAMGEAMWSRKKFTVKELKEATQDTVTTAHIREFPVMTSWFNPVLLTKLLKPVILSDLFGQYADRRLIEAALDPVTPKEMVDRARTVKEGLTADKDGAVWIDYVSDLGDGFDATYAIAYLLAQKEIKVDGKTLPRGGALILGGDEVYPTAVRDDYILKMKRPYTFALPETNEPTIPLFAIPGNHDWYDGLAMFLAIFCREKPAPIGRWKAPQRRSYFAAQLTDKVWIWGIDIALVRDMDQPQADYFVAIAKAMDEGSSIILCSAEPGWYEGETEGNAYRTLGYAASIARDAKRDLQMPIILSGDSHHYARYVNEDTQFITSGGGGAFLHGTLQLKNKLSFNWLKYKPATLKLASTYPNYATSEQLLSWNFLFAPLNKLFSLTLAGLYLLAAFVLTNAPRCDVVIIEAVLLWLGFWGYSGYQEHGSQWWKTGFFSFVHAAAHMAAIIGLSYFALTSGFWLFGGPNAHWFCWLLSLAVIVIPAGFFLAGTLFGLNLYITCRWFDMNHNDAFSSMRLDTHRHFLRMRILGDQITIYPVGLENIPSRNQWTENPKRPKAPTDPSESVFLPPKDMTPHLIEPAVQVYFGMALSTSDVKPQKP